MAGRLSHPPASIIRQMLIDLGIGTAGGTWPIKTHIVLTSPMIV